NIYTQVGLITLIGVVSKNGILIVEFANQLQKDRGLNKVDAVIEAAAIRLRPIIMTSLALIFAMVSLLIAIGPGAESRYAIGLTISAGLGIGTLFTVFVLPAFYILLARDHHGSAADEYGNGEQSAPTQAQAGNHCTGTAIEKKPGLATCRAFLLQEATIRAGGSSAGSAVCRRRRHWTVSLGNSPKCSRY